MAGHSKWANTKFRKAAQDQKRGKLFTKFIREITIAAKQGGPDPTLNHRLRAAIDKALSGNLTRDTITKAIKRASGGEEKDLDEICYEGYGPYGMAVMVYCLTDNNTRTVSNLRYFFNKHQGSLGVNGSVSYLFSKRGQILLSKEQGLSDEQINNVMEVAINSGATDFEINSDAVVMICDPKDLHVIKDSIEQLLGTESIENVTVAMVADNYIKPENIEYANKMMDFLEGLEDLEDVQEVYTNVDFFSIMIILGIDPGSCITGYGVIRSVKQQSYYITSGCIKITSKDLGTRLKQIYDGLLTIINMYQPQQVSVEKIFVHKNANSALKLAQARGAALVAVATRGLPIYEYAPREIKQAITGNGAADKKQIQSMVQIILSLNKLPPLDSADALAIAMCHGLRTAYVLNLR